MPWYQKRNPSKRGDHNILGAVNTEEYDKKYGRWWRPHKDDTRRPILYSTIGEPCRNPKLHRTILKWVHSANWKRILTNKYRKRWPGMEMFSVAFFAEFILKPQKEMNLFELCRTLPNYGIGARFWSGKRNIQTEGPEKGKPALSFQLDRIKWHTGRIPFKGRVWGTQYHRGIPIREGVAALGKSSGGWQYELPPGCRPPFPAFGEPEPEAAESDDPADAAQDDGDSDKE